MTKRQGKNNGSSRVVGLEHLERYSLRNLRHWQSVATALQDYHVALFYSLEAQRRQRYQDLLESLRTGSNIALFELESWCRIVRFKYSNEPLSSRGSLKWVGGRFNYGDAIDSTAFQPFRALYLATDFETAFREKFGADKSDQVDGLSPGEMALSRRNATSTIWVSGTVHNVFDLRDETSLGPFCEIIRKFRFDRRVKDLAKKAKIRTPQQLIKAPAELFESLLLADWRKSPVQMSIPANSQVLGKLLLDAGFEAVVYRSSRDESSDCIAIFVDNLKNSESSVHLDDSHPVTVEYPELNSTTAEHL